jgi:CheY-like chemotaxis protein
LIVTDIMMAKMDGWEFLDTIRKELRLDDLVLPVIVISAFESDTLVAKALQHGANGCLTKPIRPLSKLTKLARIHTGRLRSKFDADT